MFIAAAAAGCLLAVMLFWPLSFSLEGEGQGLKGEIRLYWRPVPALFLRKWRILLYRYAFPAPAASGKTKKKDKGSGKKKGKNDLFRLQRLLRAVSFRKISFFLGLGTGDAALTCLAGGAIYALFNSLLLVLGSFFGRFPPPPYISIEPDFSEEKFSWRAECIVDSRAGNIILKSFGGFWAALTKKGGKKKCRKTTARSSS